MKIHITMITLLASIFLTGCGVKKEHYQQTLADLEATKNELEKSNSELANLKKEILTFPK